jgi:hypothetical protein
MKRILKSVGVVLLLGFFAITFIGCTPEQNDSGVESQSEVDSPAVKGEETNQTFHGNTCTDDCSGHEAGYNWAEEKGITDPDDCGGNSNSFIEGCQSYAEENSDY